MFRNEGKPFKLILLLLSINRVLIGYGMVFVGYVNYRKRDSKKPFPKYFDSNLSLALTMVMHGTVDSIFIFKTLIDKYVKSKSQGRRNLLFSCFVLKPLTVYPEINYLRSSER